MNPMTFTFTNACGAAVNLDRLCSIMRTEGRDISIEDTQSDYCLVYIDGEDFGCDWKHNNFESWGETLRNMGYDVNTCSRSELSFTIQSPRSYMAGVMQTHESFLNAQRMFAPA